jgi:DNA uptake protein ComE-like DNA-binding protein
MSAPRSTLKGWWYFVVTVCSAGLLAWVPFVHAGRHLRRRSVTWLAWGYGAAAVAIGTLLALTPTDSHGEITPGAGDAISAVGGLLLIATVALGCVQQAPLRREVYSGAPPQERDAVDPALAAALEARERRADARQIAAQDPLLARDLKIGRPDLPHTYDDGGLVDLNSAPAQAIAAACGLSQATGEGIVAARPPGGFMVVDDVFSLADVPVAAWDVIRDRGVTIPRPD